MHLIPMISLHLFLEPFNTVSLNLMFDFNLLLLVYHDFNCRLVAPDSFLLLNVVIIETFVVLQECVELLFEIRVV